MTCQQIKKLYDELIVKIDSFISLEPDFKGNRAQAISLKKEIERIFTDIEKTFNAKITVENMPSPFAEVYTANGLPVPEKETQIIDLEKQLEEDCKAYRDCGLESWAEDIEKFLPRLKKMRRSVKEQIEREMQDGAIPIFMPGRAVQYAEAVETLTKKLKPESLDNGQQKTVKDGYLTWEYLINELKKIAKEIIGDVPEEVYLMMTKPTQKPEFTSMEVKTQKAAILKMSNERKKERRAPVFSIMPPEYAATQKFFTARAKRGGVFKKLDPLDRDTYTKFVNMPPTAGGSIPYVYWHLGIGYLVFDDFGMEAEDYSGVRLVSRFVL